MNRQSEAMPLSSGIVLLVFVMAILFGVAYVNAKQQREIADLQQRVTQLEQPDGD